MSAESNPNIHTPYSESTAIWYSFWAIWTWLPTWFQFCSSHVGQSCLVLLGNLFIYPPAQSSLTSDSSHGAHEYIQEALCGHKRCLLRWHCSTVWILLVLGVPSNHLWFQRVRGWVLSLSPHKHNIETQQHIVGKGGSEQMALTNLLLLSGCYGMWHKKNRCDMVCLNVLFETYFNALLFRSLFNTFTSNTI